jgi:uroporphyrinogen-III synthase
LRRLVILRPEPGNGRTAAAARAAGWSVDAMPLFAVTPIAWTPPDPHRFDALLLTSANAVRHAGPGLATLACLPVIAVGEATAAAARDAGLPVAVIGCTDAAAAVATARTGGWQRLLHLAGRDRVDLHGVVSMTVYASDRVPAPGDLAARLDGATVLVHSPRAARALAELATTRARTAIAALSPAVLAAAGSGWRDAVAAALPTDEALFAAAATLAD